MLFPNSLIEILAPNLKHALVTDLYFKFQVISHYATSISHRLQKQITFIRHISRVRQRNHIYTMKSHLTLRIQNYHWLIDFLVIYSAPSSNVEVTFNRQVPISEFPYWIIFLNLSAKSETCARHWPISPSPSDITLCYFHITSITMANHIYTSHITF